MREIKNQKQKSDECLWITILHHLMLIKKVVKTDSLGNVAKVLVGYIQLQSMIWLRIIFVIDPPDVNLVKYIFLP
jgi:hypothetical protein